MDPKDFMTALLVSSTVVLGLAPVFFGFLVRHELGSKSWTLILWSALAVSFICGVLCLCFTLNWFNSSDENWYKSGAVVLIWLQMVCFSFATVTYMSGVIFTARKKASGNASSSQVIKNRWFPLAVIIVLGLTLVGYGIAKRNSIEPADWMQIMITLALVVVTGVYAWAASRQADDTKKMANKMHDSAKASYDQAKATKDMAEEMKQQRQNASQPVIWPTLWGWEPTPGSLHVRLVNIGNGPALEVDTYLGRGIDPPREDCEYFQDSYIVAGDDQSHHFLRQADSQSHSNLVGEYTLLVEWRDLHLSGPYFQARMLFSLEMDSDGRLCPKSGLINIKPIAGKKRPIS